VFDSKTGFNDWFGNTKATPSGGEDDWLEMEKRVIVISRLHQILEPFMLRRMVEDVESRLPKKIAVTLQVCSRVSERIGTPRELIPLDNSQCASNV
jgi:SNF2 family DNA or RNA helicase